MSSREPRRQAAETALNNDSVNDLASLKADAFRGPTLDHPTDRWWEEAGIPTSSPRQASPSTMYWPSAFLQGNYTKAQQTPRSYLTTGSEDTANRARPFRPSTRTPPAPSNLRERTTATRTHSSGVPRVRNTTDKGCSRRGHRDFGLR